MLAVVATACGGGSSTPTSAGHWTVAHPEPPGSSAGYSSIYGVSCTGPSFCAAVDESGDATLWNGGRWSTPRPVTPGNTLQSVSCTSPTFCMALAGQQAVRFDGTTWSVDRRRPGPVGPDRR